MDELTRAIAAGRNLLAKRTRPPARNWIGLLGRADGVVVDAELTTATQQFVFVQMPDGNTVSAYNQRVSPAAGKRVVVGYDDANPMLFQVLADAASYGGMSAPPQTALQAHRHQHQWLDPAGGWDPVRVDLRAWSPFACYPAGGLTVKIYSTMFWTGAAWTRIAATVDLTAHLPTSAGQARYVLLESDAAGNIIATAGTVGSLLALNDSFIPSANPQRRSIAAIRLYSGQTAIQETPAANDVYADLRFPGVHPHSLASLESISARSLLGNSGSAAGPVAAIAAPGDPTKVLNGNLEWTTAGSSGGGAPLSDAMPQASGSPGAPGTSGSSGRGDHVHPFAAIAPLSYSALTGQISLPNATSASAGSMSAADKTKLDLLTMLASGSVSGSNTGDQTLAGLGGTPTTRTLNTTAPLTGGGDLSADRTLAISAATSASAGSMSAADKTNLDKLNGLLAVTKDPTGFTDPASVIVTYDPTARTITLTGTVTAYWQGAVVPVLVSGWTSGSHAASNGIYYLSYNGTAFVWSTSPWTFDQLQIAYVNYRGTGDPTFAIRETHGMMPWQAHEEFHDTIGCYRDSGGTLSSYAPNSTTATDRRPTISATVIQDEDNPTTCGSAAAGNYTQMSNSGSSAAPIVFTLAAAEIVPVSGNQPYYNSLTGATWGQTLMTANTYMSAWLMAIPATASAQSQKYRFLWVQGQSAGSLASQQALSPATLNLGNFAALASEFVFLAQVIINYQSAGGGNWVITSVVNLTGNHFSQVGSTSGIFLSSVSVTAPLTGDGTSGSALGVSAFTATTSGIVPSPSGSAGKFLRDDATWQTVTSGSGSTPLSSGSPATLTATAGSAAGTSGSASRSDHVHAITSGSNSAGATSSILLSTSGSGGLILDRLGVGSSGSVANSAGRIVGNKVSGFLPFGPYGMLPSNITTSPADVFSGPIPYDTSVVLWVQGGLVNGTNDASNYWTIIIYTNGNSTTLDSFTTTSYGGYSYFSRSSGAVNWPITASLNALVVRATKTGNPGPLYMFNPAVFVL